jgi:adenylosuccinate lyase
MGVHMVSFEFTGGVVAPKNVLASRYASPDMVRVFSDEARIYYERCLWIAIMEGQVRHGLDIPAVNIDDYRKVMDQIDTASINEREKKSRHDVNARIEEFNTLAGHQDIQKGMTSRDLTENVEQLQIRLGMEIIQSRIRATLSKFATRAAEYSSLVMAGRSHNVPAQMITMGKRFSNAGEELLRAYEAIEQLMSRYSLRGIKGPVGTQQDMLDLLGTQEDVEEFELGIANELGFESILGSVGQVYPRSMDFEIITALQRATTGPVNFAKTLRLMSGNELVTEGFVKGQVGSNAMPHKMNAPTSERISGLYAVIAGNTTTASLIAADQWNEGDVSCSVARRVILPDTFYATDGLFQSAMKVLDGMGVYPKLVDIELHRYMPFLATTKALMIAVKAGMGRERAHEIIKEHAVAVALAMREKGQKENDLFDRLDADRDLPVTKLELVEATSKPIEMTGLAETQVARFVVQVEEILAGHTEDVSYKPTLLV